MASRLERFRKNKDEFFKTDPHSPLMPAQQDDFEGLSYFPENDDLVFEVELDEDAVSHEPVELDTTTGDPQTFVPAGLIQIEIEQTPITLTLFREQGRGRYFLPFRDATSGEETYDLGRYLDPQETPDGIVHVNFNYAYNPYCAYNDRWSCPIPPPENDVPVAIRAGEKTFPHD